MKLPTRDEFAMIIENAKVAGRKAAESRYIFLKERSCPNAMALDLCGNAYIILSVDGRSKLGKFLNSIQSSPLLNVSVTKSNRDGGYVLFINDMGSYHELSVWIASNKAALEVIKEGLVIDGRLKEYNT